MVLEAIKYDRQRGTLEILDQLQLPHRTVYRFIHNAADGFDAIKTMQVRGAPAIAIVAALSVAAQLHDVQESTSQSSDAVLAGIQRDLDYLVKSRPTAVNLAGAAHMLRLHVQDVAAKGASGSEIAKAYIARAAQMLEDDVADNKSIGEHGRTFILRDTAPPVSIVTHCNTGSLATAGWGTALGVIRAVHAAGQLQRAFCTETRPYNQGSRLTAYELVEEKIPGTLVTDSMAAALLRLKKDSERIAAVVVGADRVAANGDTANKIGTYALAVNAKFHGVKFLVAAPATTIDLNTPSGDAIVIEERAGHELTTIRGPPVLQAQNAKTPDQKLELDVDNAQTISIAARGIDVWNPAFDVTPASLIDGIVTEHGVVERASNGSFPLREFLEEKGVRR